MIRPARMLSPLATALINAYQGGVPLTPRPYADIAQALDSTESEIIRTLDWLLAGRWLTRFGPLFDAAALGGDLTLAALRVDDGDYDRVAELVNGHAEVAHNYRREHELNMWCVIATAPGDDTGRVIADIERRTGLEVLNFPKQREFYVGLWLAVDADGVTTVPVPGREAAAARYAAAAVDRRIIRHTQAGLALTPEPWSRVARQCGVTTGTVIARVRHMLAAGVVRRIGAVPNHYKLGLRANGMSVWNVADDAVASLGRQVGALDFVSHCYQRPRHEPAWPYNLFAMVHGHDRDEVEARLENIAATLGEACRAQDVLYSSAILKKTGMRLAA